MTGNRVTVWSSLLVAACMLGMTNIAIAQFNATIQGTVADPTGAIIPGATITATNQATNVPYTGQSTGSGNYRISGLPPGVYSVAVEAPSFSSHTDSDVRVAAEQPRGLDVTLTPASSSTTVTVSAENAVELQTQNGNVEGNLSTAQVQALPKFGRDPYELLRLTPGVYGTGARSSTGGAVSLPNTTGPGGSSNSIFQIENQVNISANGQRVSSNNYMIDGVDVNSQTWGGAAVVTPNPDSIKEIHVISSQYSAETGRNSGATVQVVTQSGTNKFHGGGFFQYQDPSLNAYNGFGGISDGGQPIRPVKVQNKWREYGAHVGGPIFKDHLFFFFSYEGLHSNSTTVSTPQFILTPQFQQLLSQQRGSGFANSIVNAPGLTPRVNQIVAPSCAQFDTASWPCAVVPGGLDIGSPFGTQGQYVPVFSGNAALQAGAGLDGIPDIALATLNQPTHETPNAYNGRLDYNLGPHQFSATAIVTKGNQTSFTDSTAPGQDLTFKPLNGAVTFAWVYAISPTWLNDFRVNGTRFAYSTLNPSTTGINFGLPYVYIEGFPNGVPNLNVTAIRQETQPASLAENTYELRDNVTKIIGRHAIKFGGEFRREQNNDNLAGGARPAFAFHNIWNLFNDTPIFEGINADPRTGAASTAQRYFRDYDYGVFFQDDFKVSPTFTLNVGLRYEFYQPITEAKGRLTNFFPGAGGLDTGLINGSVNVVSQYTNSDKNNIAPRLGFAWAPSAFDNKTVIRGGFGLAYDRIYDSLLANSRANPPFYARFGLCCGTAGPAGGDGFGTPFDNGLVLLSTSSNGIQGYQTSPTLATQLPLGANNLPTGGGGSVEIYGAPQNFPNPYVYLYSLEVQQEFPWKLIGTVGYQGSETRKEIRIVNQNFIYNAINPGANAIYFPTPDVNGNFNALNANINRNFSNLQFAANYRWSKSMDQLSFGGPGSVTNQTFPRDQKFEYGPSDYDAKHYFNFSTVYELPFFRGGKGMIANILGGFNLSTIFTYSSGLPWTPVTTQTCLPVASQCLSPYRPSGVLQTPVYSNSYSALTHAGANFPGGGSAYYNLTPGIPAVGRNSFRGPDYKSVDLSVAKSFRFTETVGIQLRANAFNALNITNLLPFTFGASNTVINNQNFGRALGSTAGRVLELQARFSF